MDTGSALALINPKFPHNVGGALRAGACFGAEKLRWTGNRVSIEEIISSGGRLPREERLRVFRDAVDWKQNDHGLRELIALGYTPVCVEVLENAESLPDFVHPEKAVYVFGPEDGSIPKGFRTACHRFVSIPTATCLNLAVSTSLVLYDRLVKMRPEARLMEELARLP